MKNLFGGFGKVFAFTFRHHVSSAAYKRTLAILLSILILVPAAALPLAEIFSKKGEKRDVAVENWIVADLTGEEDPDWSVLSYLYPGSTVSVYSDTESAFADDRPGRTLCLVVNKDQNGYKFDVLSPVVSLLDEKDAGAAADVIRESAYLLVFARLDLENGLPPELVAPVESDLLSPDGEGTDPVSAARDVVVVVVPYVVLFLLYFMILFFGIGVANSVIMEKNSKLLDMMLVSVRTDGMLLGKVCAVALSGVLQFVLYIAGTVAGFAIGTAIVKVLSPDTTMGIIRFIESLSFFKGVFSVTNVLLTLLIFVAGFFLYCALASVGGAMAGKPEDLSSTNLLFTVILVFSYMFTINPGGAGVRSSGWVEWFPFTSILVLPGKIILGEVSPLRVLGAFAVIVVTAVLVIRLAARIYRMMAFYRGNAPKVGDVLKSVFSKN